VRHCGLDRDEKPVWLNISVNGSKKLNGMSNFLTNSCKFSREEIMGAQNYNCVVKIPKMGDFRFNPKLIWHFWRK